MKTSLYKIILGNYLNPITDLKCQLIKDAGICLKYSDKKKGYCVLEVGAVEKILKKYGEKSDVEIINRSDKMILPSFFDMHFHWVQDDVRLMPKDSLLEWLANYTWPYEAKFRSIDYTREKVAKFTQELLAVGTLGGACYASIHPHSVEMALESFIGDFTVGNVLMTMNSPEYLIQSESEATLLVKDLSSRFKQRYALTPRFAPTTSPKVMSEASKIAKKNKSFIQTHLSETKNEIDYVLQIYKKLAGFEDVKSYTEIYKRTGILSKKTIMGHGIYLTPQELKMLAQSKTAIAHCPTSNAPVKELGLGSGLFNFKLIEKNKIPWALGSDIGGGPYLSMFDVMRSFVEQNKKKKIKAATYTKALYRSTLAGAKILGLDKSTGNLEKGKLANFIVLPAPKIKKDDNAEAILKKIISSNTKKRELYDSIIEETYFRGECQYRKNESIKK